MSDTSDGQSEKQVAGTVTAFYPSEDEEDPNNVYVDGDKYSTFDDATVENVAEGVAIRFRAAKNGEYWNIVDGTVERVDAETDDVTEDGNTETGNSAVVESPRDRSIRATVALQQARELCQPLMTEEMSEARFYEVVDLVCETAETFAVELYAVHREGEA